MQGVGHGAEEMGEGRGKKMKIEFTKLCACHGAMKPDL